MKPPPYVKYIGIGPISGRTGKVVLWDLREGFLGGKDSISMHIVFGPGTFQREVWPSESLVESTEEIFEKEYAVWQIMES